MLTSVGRFAKVKNGLSHDAVVEVEIETPSSTTYISLNCKGQGYAGQGYIEVVPKIGYESWKMGAIVGINFAIRICNPPPCKINVTKIEGLTTDTNPTVVAAAAMDALWKAFKFEPTLETKTYIENTVFNSWLLPLDAIPYFDSLFKNPAF
jgi:hypothetical protein